MTQRLTTIERAYELAKSGECATVSEIKAKLKAERFADVDGQLYGRTIMSALRKLCDAAQAEAATTATAKASA
ncbi:MAG: hypothetical protein V4466_04925 [Pseudomonadota bacterium]